jgi:ferredoxin
MSGRIAKITFFSGTGNTRRACALLAAGLERAGWRVSLSEIAPPRREGQGGSAASGAGAERPDLAVFAFPVFALGLPRIVRRYVRELPAVDGTPAAVLSVFGDYFSGPPAARRRGSGYEGGAPDEAARLLARKGYDVRTARAAGFPASFIQFVPAPDAGECRLLLKESEAAVAALADDLDAGRHRRQPKGGWSRFQSALLRELFALLGRRMMGKLYVADERCTSCGWCERACPVQTIRLRGAKGARGPRRLPRWGWRCEACQRCINGCPEASIQVSVFRILVLLAVAALPWARWLAAVVPSLAFPGSRILAWLVGTALATVVVDLLLRPLERVPGARRVLFASYTRKFRRYPGPPGG